MSRARRKTKRGKRSRPRPPGGSVGAIVEEVRRELKRHASPAYARRMQMFFRSPVRTYGCRTALVRKLAARLRREIAESSRGRRLLPVAEKLFSCRTLEESTLGVVLLERSVVGFGDAEFRRLEGWLRWVSNWAACDALSTALLGPLIIADSRRLPRLFGWARSRNRWRRRAAVVSLVPAGRKGLYVKDILRLAEQLLPDADDMVQKGVGWLLKETSKAKPSQVIGYLLRVRHRAPRLTLRIACEKLPASDRRRILA